MLDNILYILDMRIGYMVYMAEMKKGELKQEVEKLLRDVGPLRSAEIAMMLAVEQRSVICALRSMLQDGRVFIAIKDRKKAHVWAVIPRW